MTYDQALAQIMLDIIMYGTIAGIVLIYLFIKIIKFMIKY